MMLVIPCAGRGRRFGGYKALVQVNGRTLLQHVVRQWPNADGGLAIVTNWEALEAVSRQCLHALLVVQDSPTGIADAILRVEPFVEDRFVVNLGDCLFKGRWLVPPPSLGIGVLNAPYDGGYTVDIEDNRVVRVYEKSAQGRYLGMGVYFLDSRVFGYIRRTPPSALRGEVEITDVIQNMVDTGEVVVPVWFEGEYLNVTYPEDTRKAEALVR
jgi:dTDP-glucose pyrophosphorylase